MLTRDVIRIVSLENQLNELNEICRSVPISPDACSRFHSEAKIIEAQLENYRQEWGIGPILRPYAGN